MKDEAASRSGVYGDGCGDEESIRVTEAPGSAAFVLRPAEMSWLYRVAQLLLGVDEVGEKREEHRSRTYVSEPWSTSRPASVFLMT
jgi:hypothetical protein